ncbi:MAG: tRNA threonylcarbamoyladenosine dehydratase [Ruminococcaceae bacterium]|nr:tRNA threonylcarbamoyladenosine dehydratase [Oscillospiraceae bacterium]
MKEQFIRTEMLLGKEAVEKLKNSRVAVFGIGGVGGHTAEALIRAGVGTLDIVDSDRVSVSNINRQIFALHSTVGEYKVDVAKARLLDINPEAVINTYSCFYLPEESRGIFDFSLYDYVVDAIDTVSGKIGLVMECQRHDVPIISSMGTGNKVDPTMLKVSDIYKTSVCPLARVMRNELKKRGVKRLKVVYSEETPIIPHFMPEEDSTHPRRTTPASSSFVPSVAGLIIASEVIKDLAKKQL